MTSCETSESCAAVAPFGAGRSKKAMRMAATSGGKGEWGTGGRGGRQEGAIGAPAALEGRDVAVAGGPDEVAHLGQPGADLLDGVGVRAEGNGHAASLAQAHERGVGIDAHVAAAHADGRELAVDPVWMGDGVEEPARGRPANGGVVGAVRVLGGGPFGAVRDT